MKDVRSRGCMRVRAVAVGISLLALTGCANPLESALESVAEQIPAEAQEALSDDGRTSTVTAEIPGDFPASVPLPDATPSSAASYVDDGVSNWIVQYHGGFADDVVDHLGAQLIAQGYVEDSSSSMPGAVTVAVYTDTTYTVSLGLLGDGDSQILQIIVLAGRE